MSDAGGLQGRYLFAVTRGLDEETLGRVTGVHQAPLEVVRHGDLQAVVCTVDLDEFGEEPLARNLEDLQWLEEVARAHNDVVFAVASAGTVAPMRLVTICSDEASVRDRIAGLHDQLSAALDRVEGRREWSVKVYDRSEKTLEPAESSRPSSGAAYLRHKRDLAAQRRSTGEQSLRVAEEIDEMLSSHVAASRRLSPQDPRLTGRSEPMVLNGAYLVEAEDTEGFGELVRGLVELHPTMQIEVDGPWPPYSFAMLD